MSVSKQKIEIELIDGKPVVSKEMVDACSGRFGVWAEDEGGNKTDYAFIENDLLIEIYQAMVVASIGNAGKTVNSNPDLKDIRIVFSVPGNIGAKEWVKRNHLEPKTLADLNVIRDEIKRATYYSDVIIIAWEALEIQII